MMNLAEYQQRPACLSDYLPWAAVVAPGVILNKDGSFLRCARFRGPDLDSATESELTFTASRINNALKRLGSGWAVFVEAERHPAVGYPRSLFPDALSYLVDEERRGAFEEEGSHFESAYYLSILFLPPPERHARARQLLFDSRAQVDVDWKEQLELFITETDRFLSLLQGVMPEIAWLSDSDTLSYLHGTVSGRRQGVGVPEVAFALDALLTDEPFTGGLSPALGQQHLRIITVRGFPTSTWPGMLDELNRLSFGYRWMTRFLFMDKVDAERELTKIRRQWFAKRKSIVALLRETVFQQETQLIDSDAANKATDADEALQELGSDAAAYGYVTASIVVSDADPARADEKRKAIERCVQGHGFIAIAEGLNATEAWLGSIPGHAYANVRQALISTLNLAHLIPLSAPWAGPERNGHLDGPPLIVTRSDGSTPFRLVTHVGDVGHTLIVGPTGSGKSVLLSLIVLQFRRYKNARIFIFDKGRSLRATILGLSGEYYELSSDGSLAFQPLSRIDEEAERAWASDWLASLLAHEHVAITPEVKDALWSALQSLASAPKAERSLTGLSVLLQSNRLRQALQPYTLNGPFGRLLDADEEALGIADLQAFEMEELMHTRSAVQPVLTYLFHRLDDRFHGAPTLLVLDEAWLFLDDPIFASSIREWLKTLRKKNVSVLFATQSLSDIQRSAIAPALIESCPTRILLPSPQAMEPQIKSVYQGFGLNDRQISLIAHGEPKRDYYYQSRLGHRVFDLGLGPIALAFAGAQSGEDHRAMDEVLRTASSRNFASAWLKHKGLDWAAQLIDDMNPTQGDRP